MFTGLVESVGTIEKIHTNDNSSHYRKFRVLCELDDIAIGDSVCVNGVCLTVVAHSNKILRKINKSRAWFEVEAFQVTLEKTNFLQLQLGSVVNIERAMRTTSRFGGHVVTGHVQDTALITNIQKEKENTMLFVKCNTTLLSYMIEEGSVTIEGISLTIAKIESDIIILNIITHTLQATNLRFKNESDIVNVECDVYCKYLLELVKKVVK